MEDDENECTGGCAVIVVVLCMAALGALTGWIYGSVTQWLV